MRDLGAAIDRIERLLVADGEIQEAGETADTGDDLFAVRRPLRRQDQRRRGAGSRAPACPRQ